MAEKTQTDTEKIFALLSGLSIKFSNLESKTDQVAQSVTSVSSRILELEKDLADDSKDRSFQSGSHSGDKQKTDNPPLSLLDKMSNSHKVPKTLTSSPIKRPGSPHLNLSLDRSVSSPPRKKSKKKKVKSSRVSSSEDEGSDAPSIVDVQMEELLDEYKTTKPKYLEDPTTSPIQDSLAKMLETWFWTVYSKEEVKTELAKPLRPENAHALIPTKINEAIFRSLSQQALSKDMPSRFVQNAFMKASQCFSIVWSTLIAFENFLKASDMDVVSTFSSSLTIDFQALRKQMAQGL